MYELKNSIREKNILKHKVGENYLPNISKQRRPEFHQTNIIISWSTLKKN